VNTTPKRKPLFERLKESLEQGIRHERGEITLKSYTVTLPDKPPPFDKTAILALRERLDVDQVVFAGLVNVTVGTVRQWEDGKRKPGGAAARLLQVYAERPDVAEALRRGTNGAGRNRKATAAKQASS
jgi:putative transcriptional regulator